MEFQEINLVASRDSFENWLERASFMDMERRLSVLEQLAEIVMEYPHITTQDEQGELWHRIKVLREKLQRD